MSVNDERLNLKTKNAFVLIHFGSNPIYLELEIYFLISLRKHTKNNILYLYSIADTPHCFVEAIRPYVTQTIPYDDTGITFNIPFSSHYTSFNTLRTCNYIFAYTLTDYDKICLLESDMVVVQDIDSIFNLKTPSVHNVVSTFDYSKNNNANKPYKVIKNPTKILNKCRIDSTPYVSQTEINGGVMLIKPSIQMFDSSKKYLKLIIENGCKYPNETLFVYMNPVFYNLPVKYNMMHWVLKNMVSKQLPIWNAQGTPIVYHFNEAQYKHLDMIKDQWLENNANNEKIMEKYKLYKIPVFYFRDEVYNPNKEHVTEILNHVKKELEHSSDKVVIPINISIDSLKDPTPIKSLNKSLHKSSMNKSLNRYNKKTQKKSLINKSSFNKHKRKTHYNKTNSKNTINSNLIDLVMKSLTKI